MEWVPIKEATPVLPEGADYLNFLVTVNYSGFLYTTTAIYDGNSWYSYMMNEDGTYFQDNVVAWMPLPMPYEVEEEVFERPF